MVACHHNERVAWAKKVQRLSSWHSLYVTIERKLLVLGMNVVYSYC